MEINKLKAKGFNIIPLKPKSKEPMGGFSWKTYQYDQYTENYPEDCNLGVICGTSSNNIYVVDLDDFTLFDDYPADMKDTYIVKTGKGYHIYYSFKETAPPNIKLDDKRGRHIDVKSQGGYVLASGSTHPNGKKYTAINDLPIKYVGGKQLKAVLDGMGFESETKMSIEEISKGISQGGRNDMTFKFACAMIRNGIYSTALEYELEKLNAKHSPPLPKSEVDMIQAQAEKAENSAMLAHVKQAKSVLSQLRSKPDTVAMQDIDPKYEGVPISFDCMIIAVGERMTYTISADFECTSCGDIKKLFCDNMYRIGKAYCSICKAPMKENDSTKVTGYIQQLRIQEFLETARKASPVEFDAEIIDSAVGTAYIGDRKTVVATFRSISKEKEDYNNIVFKITEMKNLEQQAGCLPTAEEIEKWKGMDIFSEVVSSIAPDIYIDPKIIQSLVLWACGGNSLNGKRDLIHMAIFGDAQLGKSELLLKMHKILSGSGFTVGKNTSGAGLTISMVKLYNGAMVPRAGFFPQHTGHPCIIDEIDKMKKDDQASCLDVMEQQTTSQAKAGTGGGLTLPTKCPLLVAGNPKNGKFNDKYPTIMDNFDMDAPFVSRFDILWLLVDDNNPETDKEIRKFIRSYQERKGKYMELEELQRYFEYIRGLNATIPDEFMDKIDDLHTRMRPLNVGSGVPIGIRQYHGLYRLLTSCAKANLRSVVNDEDFRIVEDIITASYTSMRMDLKTGSVKESFTNVKESDKPLLVWGEVMDATTKTVDQEEFIKALIGQGFKDLRARQEFEKIPKVYDNELERWKRVD